MHKPFIRTCNCKEIYGEPGLGLNRDHLYCYHCNTIICMRKTIDDIKIGYCPVCKRWWRGKGHIGQEGYKEEDYFKEARKMPLEAATAPLFGSTKDG